ncbi:IS630 family transposase [Streptomyces sp. NPDC057540]|uniref:IS630 family transposase n=1 Tax=Streptomyces sp. NPDC057540 TaxID=3346160 RepID=UPI003675C322
MIADAMWGRIELLMPADPVRGRRWADHRRTLEAIAWKYRTCSPWRDLPDELGSYQTAYKRLIRWAVDGTRERTVAAVLAADEDTVRDLIHRFNEIGLACLDPRWAGGRPHLLSLDDEDFVVATATTRPTKLGRPFTRWSIRKLAAYLRTVRGRTIRIRREALRCLLARRGVTFQRTKTWKESTDPDRDATLDRIEHVLQHLPDRVFAFDEFGPLGIRPTGGSCWAKQGRPDRVPATYHRTHGVTYFHGCYSVGDDTLWGVNHRRNGAVNSLAALRSIRAARPDGAPIYVIMDNLSARKGAKIRTSAKKNKVELCFTPTNASWANPIEAHFGPLRQFTLANSNHPNHTVQTRELHRHLCWRNANARHPDVLAAQRRERARIRSEKGIRWGGRPLKTAA